MPLFGQSPLEGIRHSQYAGSWYEADGKSLALQLDRFLEGAGSERQRSADQHQGSVLAIIAPHAGYMYSGQTAAASYQLIERESVNRVFLLGPSHHVALHGVALPSASSFETPLGDLDVDETLIAELKSYPLFSIQPEIHQIEHSLEMQLPFIRQVLGNVKIVPIVVGTLSDESEVRLIAEILKGYISKGDLIVISSDFTHYGPRYDYQPFTTDMKSNIEKLDKEAFLHLSQKDVTAFMDFQQRTQDTICGFYPCAILCAMLPDNSNAQLLKYSTSQDVAHEDKDNSVSYLAISFTGKNWPENPGEKKNCEDTVKLSQQEKTTLLGIARQTLEGWVRGNKTPSLEKTSAMITPHIRECFGAFVTLYKKSSHGGVVEERSLHPTRQLRGCIGNIWPVRPLYQAVAENAISACSRDNRFTPVKPEELEDIEIEISILTPPRRVPSYKDIILGTDGIILSKNNRQAVFLPLVPTEFGWDLHETLRQLSIKAGLQENDWQEGAHFDLFQSVSIDEK